MKETLLSSFMPVLKPTFRKSFPPTRFQELTSHIDELSHLFRFWQLYRDVSFSISVMWSEPETCAPKYYWKVELTGREGEAGRCEDGQMISRTGQADQWRSVQGWQRKTTMETAGAWNHLRSSVMRMKTSKQTRSSIYFLAILVNFCVHFLAVE